MNSDPAVKKRNLFKVVYVALCFTLLFTAFQVAQNLVTQIYKEFGYDSLGQACVFTIYCFLGGGSIVASHIKRNVTHRTGLFLGGSGYALFIIIGAFTTSCHKFDLNIALCSSTSIYVLNIIFCMFVGMGASILWLTQSDYVNQCCDESTKGLFNSVFWSIMQCSQILGSVLGTFVLGITDQFTFYMVLLAFAFIAVLMFAFSPRIEERAPDASGTGSLVASEQPKQTLGESVKQYFTVIKRPRSAFMLITMYMIGIVIAFYASELSNLIDETINSTDTNTINERVGIVLIALAIGEVSAGLTVGRLADKMDKTKLLHYVILIPELGLVVSLITHLTKVYGIGVIAGFIWGFSDTALNAMMTTMIGAYFGGILELFCIMRSMTGLGVVYGSAIALGLTNPLTYILVIMATMAILHLLFIKITPNDLENKDAKTESLILS